MDNLKIEYLPVEDLIPYENNPRKNDDAVEYVANSIGEFGFKVPIVIDKENVIIAGHTRLKAAKELGIKEVPCIVADDLTEEQIKAFRIADNKTSEKSLWDNNALKVELTDIMDEFDMTDFGFGDFELTILTGDFEPEPYDDEIIDEYSKNEDEYLERKRVIITYLKTEEEKVKKLLGVSEIRKVLYDVSEL